MGGPRGTGFHNLAQERPSRGDALRVLTGEIYLAAGDPKVWTRLLRTLRIYLGADSIFIGTVQFNRNRMNLLYADGASTGDTSSALTHDSDADLILARGLETLPEGGVIPLSELVATARLRECQFFREWMAPNELDVCMLLKIDQDDRQGSFLAAVGRSTEESLSGRRTAHALRELHPHLRHALQLEARLRKLERERRAVHSALNRLPIGVLIVGRANEPVWMNCRARELLRAEDARTLPTRDAQRSPFRPNSAALKSALLKLLNGRGMPAAVRQIADDRSAGHRDEPRRVIFFNDPNAQVQIDPSWMSEFYNLTPTEAKLTQLLSQGISLKVAASSLGIAVGTARVHLKHIFAKTGTTRQAELVRLIWSGPTPVADSSDESRVA